MNSNYWQALDKLVQENGFEVERPKDSAHPKYPDYIYPLDYGFIPNTNSDDGAEIDAWRGSIEKDDVTAVAATYDGMKKDMELKVLIGCSEDDIEKIKKAHNQGDMVAMIIHRGSNG